MLWEALEQFLHLLLGGLAALPALCVILLVRPKSFKIGAGAMLASSAALAVVRELAQNWGDEPDETTLFMLAQLPVNLDLLVDLVFTTAGGLLPLVAVWIISLRR